MPWIAEASQQVISRHFREHRVFGPPKSSILRNPPNMSLHHRLLAYFAIALSIAFFSGSAAARTGTNEGHGAAPAIAPVINSVNPPNGTTSGGYLITLSGFNLGTSGTLQFGGQFLTAPQVTSWTNTAITFFAPAGQGGFVQIIVTPSGSTAATNFFSYIAPVLQNLTYTSAPTSGGVSVVVTGQHLGTSATIFVGSHQATGVIAAHTLLVFTLPAGAGAGQQVTAFVGGQLSNALTLNYDPPVISPSSVAVASGATMTINGQNFGTSGAQVLFNGTPCANVVHTIPHTQITCTVPPGNGTNIPLTVTVASQASAVSTRNYERPIINSVSQLSGPTSGGTTITIAGSNFGPSNVTVTIGNVVAPQTFTSMSSIVCLTPAGTGTQPLVVTSAGQDSASGTYFSYGSPSITSVTPAVAAAGQTITIEGDNFGASGAEVRINGVLCTSITQTQPTAHTTITCVVPIGAGVALPLTVKNAGDATVAQISFSYPPPFIMSLPTTLVGGQTITINGTNFGASGATVTVGGVNFTNVAHSIPNTQITATCPIGSGVNLPVVVRVGSQNSAPFLASYAAPAVSGILPGNGSTAGGYTAFVTGSNFGLLSGSVMIGGSTAAVVSWSNTSIVVTIPPGVGKDLPVRVIAQNLQSAANVLFDYDPPEICPIASPVAAGETLTITGANFGVSGAIVTINGNPATNVVHSVAHEELTVTVPQGYGLNRPLVVTVGLQASSAILVNYEAPVITSIAPQSGSTAGGATITVVGKNFYLNGGSLTIGSEPAQIISHSPTELVALTPAGVGSQPVAFSISGQTSTEPIVYNYGTPTITSVTPSGAAAGATISIDGENFGATASEVRINGVLCAVTAWDHTSVSVTVPMGVGANVPLTIRNTSGPAVGTSTFSYPAPMIDTVTPSPIGGGQTLTINGSNFGASGAIVYINGVTCTDVVHVIANTRITATCPIGSGIGVPVVVSAGSQNSAPKITSYAAPSVMGIVPAHGPTSGAFPAIVGGSNFGSTQGSVLIGNVAATVLSWTNTSVSIAIPPGVGADQIVRVTVQGQVSNSNILFDYDAPDLCPLTEPIIAGGTLTLTGENFGAAGATVTIGGIPATNVVHSVAHEELTLTVPQGVGVDRPLIVTVGQQSSPTILVDYEAPVITSVSPQLGPTAGGAAITVTGRSLGTSGGLLTIGGASVSITTHTPTQIVGTTPAGVGTRPVQYLVGGQPSTSQVDYTYGTPSITGIVPPVAAPGASIQINGDNFGIASGDVTINNVPCSGVQWTHTSVTCLVPAGVGANLPVTLRDTDGRTSNAGTFSYPLPVVNSVTPAPIVGGQTITINGQYFGSSGASVTIDGVACTNVAHVSGGTTTLTAVAPIGVGLGRPLRVTAGAQSSLPLPVNYARPVVSSITPATGPTTGGTTVTITGQSFGTTAGIVTIDGVSAPVVTWTNTSIVATTPEGTGADNQVMVIVQSQVSTDQAFFDYAPPVLTTVSPTTVEPGDIITIDGMNFGVSSFTVRIGGVTAASFGHSVPHTQVIAMVPMGVGTNKTVVVEIDGQSSNPLLVDYAAPTITDFAPHSLPTTGGTMTITGTGFGPGLPPSGVVLAHSTAGSSVPPIVCNVANWSPTSLTVVVPPGVGTDYDVKVIVDQITKTASQRFSYDAPTIASFTPHHAPPGASTQMTITGTNFGPGNLVVAMIGIQSLTNIAVVDHETITGTIPAGVGVDLPVVVSLAGRSVTAVDTFDYDGPVMDPVVPNHGPTVGGTVITITGQNIVAHLATASVKIDGVACAVQSSGNGFIHAVTPAGFGANRPVVVTIGTLSTSGTFSYDAPVLEAISVDHGPTQGGTAVTITGHDFGASQRPVTLGGSPCVVSNWQHSSIEVLTPAGVGLDHAFVVDFADLPRTIGAFDYDAPSITIPPAHLGAPGGGSTVTLFGINFGESGAIVTVDSIPATNVFHTIPHQEITFTVPVLSAVENIPVIVTVGGRSSAPILLSAAPPTIASINPPHLPTTGGTVTLLGDLFAPGTLTMTLDGAPFTNFTVVSANEISMTVPAGVGTGKAIRVAVGGRQSNVVGFDYDAPRIDRFVFNTPALGHHTKLNTGGGTEVFVVGANFGPGVPTITLGGTPMPVAPIYHDQAKFTAPPGFAADLPVVVTVGGQTSNVALLSYAPPTVRSMSRESGSVDGGDAVTITGAHFGSSGTVKIGTVSAVVSSWTSTQIVITTPRQAGYALPVVIDNGVQTSSYRGFTYTAPTATNGSLSLPSHDPVTFLPTPLMSAQVPHHASLDFSGDFTFECQARIDSWYTYAFFGKTTVVPNAVQGPGSPNVDGFTFFTRLGTTLGVVLNGQTLSVIGNDFFLDDQVHHFAVARSGNEVKFYVDGALIGQQLFSAAIITNTAPLMIGDTIPGTSFNQFQVQSQPFRGELDEVRIWNVARTAAEIRDFIPVALAGDETGLVAMYRFDEPSGQTIVNSATAAGAALDGFLGASAAVDTADPIRVAESPFPRLDLIPSIGAGNRYGNSPNSDQPLGLEINGIGRSASPGPFHVVWRKDEPLTLTWNGQRDLPLILLAGTRNPAALVTTCPGIIDLGTAPSFSDVFVIADGNSPFFPGPLFRLDNQGFAQQSFAYSNLPAGQIVNLQGIYFDPFDSSCPVHMTAAFYVTVAP